MSNRSPATATTKEKPSVMPMRSSLLQRKCACGNSAGMVGECSDCQKKSLVQRKGIDRANTSESPPIAHEFPIQTKLTVGKPGDIYEQEADRVAAQVMSRGNSSPSIQPATTMRKKEVQTKRCAGESPAGSNIESRLNSSKSGGSPLSDDVRSFMEPRFGADFSQVRVHTDSEAVQMNRDLNAQAFTHGSHIYYSASKFAAKNDLTAHELTHVIQQGAASDIQNWAINGSGETHIPSSKVGRGIGSQVVQRWPGDGMDPPGDCGWATYLGLRGSVETAKVLVSTLGACSLGDNCPSLATKIAAITAEIAARVALDATCFKGGDTGHRQQVQDKIAMMNRCYRFFNGSNCSPELLAAMAVVVEAVDAVVAVAAGAVATALVVALIVAIIALVEVIVALAVAAAEAAAVAEVLAALMLLLKPLVN